MKSEEIDWEQDLPLDADEAYQSLVRSLKRTDGFALLFVRCSPVQGDQILTDVRADLPSKTIEILELKESIDNLYDHVAALPNRDQINVLFIKGIEHSIFAYEDREKNDVNFRSQSSLYGGTWKGVPRVLGNLNLSRERFRDNFKFCFVFLIREFTFRYFIRRAPDFFDWRSGVIDMPEPVLFDYGEEYESLVQSLRHTDGFSVLFVRCSPVQSVQIVNHVCADLPSKTIESLELKESIDNLYDLVATLPNCNQINVLFIRGIEYSIFAYEDREMNDISLRSKSSIYGGIGKGAPRVLGNLNLSRELFRDNFKFCIVFLLPEFALRYFIRRAPAFFDWRSNIYDISTEKSLVDQEAFHLASDGSFDEYQQQTKEQRIAKLCQIKSYIDESSDPTRTSELWVEKGLIHAAANEHEEAIASYDRALEIKPDYHEAWNNRGVALFNLGRYEEAIASYDRALEIKPDYHEAWYNRGVTLFNLGRYEEAIASYDRALEIKPDYHEAWYNRGIALFNLGRYEEAIASYDKVINIDPENASTYYVRALTRYELGDVAGAVADYIETIRLNPNYAGDSEKLELLLESIHKESNTSFCSEDITPIEGYWFENIIGDESYSLIYIKHSITEDSKDKLAITGLNIQENSIFRRFEADCISVDKNKNNTVLYYYKASTKLVRQDRRDSYIPGFGTITFYDIDEHKLQYLKAKGSFVDSVDNKVERTKVIAKSFKWYRIQQEDIPEEIILLFENKENEQYLDYVKNFIGNNIHTWNSRGDILRQLDRYEEAIFSYDKALAIKPDFYEAWDNLGIALFELGRYEEAIASYDKALAIKPNFYYAWNNRGDALSELGKYKEAIASYDRALTIKSDDRYAWDNRGDALSELGRYEEAIASYDKALAIKPDDHDTLNNRGISLDELGRYEEAIASYDKALAIKPNFHYAWNNRGDSLRQLLRYEEALDSYDKAVAIQPNFHYAWDNRGDVLSELDRYEEAIASYDKALAVKPDFYFTWHNRGTALDSLSRYEEAILSYDRALEIKPDFHEAWSNRGFALFNLGKYEEAINSYDKALEIKPDEPKFYYNKACAYSLLNTIKLALENLQKAIQLDPEKSREMAKTDSDFDNIRHDPRFQALIQ
ncbi:tetratricopeptide repeat protein [Pseudanabaena sp. UWO311]|uniref:tetratricopeptide repeat protein n=1 Tax=Pseudanabaena sp. UWO311 TaxID=2487337 RepID=UPI001159146C|nr:tetratricopeptide repeat protein [Pseudanabaena sp. UWO311]TYQ27619.1 tetratricopeptide repeat protein [Pseudanabaena sp. UWO311]